MKSSEGDAKLQPMHKALQVFLGLFMGSFIACLISGPAFVGSEKLSEGSAGPYIAFLAFLTIPFLALHRHFAHQKGRYRWLISTARVTFLVYAAIGVYVALLQEGYILHAAAR